VHLSIVTNTPKTIILGFFANLKLCPKVPRQQKYRALRKTPIGGLIANETDRLSEQMQIILLI
jgi:hypothetical protein